MSDEDEQEVVEPTEHASAAMEVLANLTDEELLDCLATVLEQRTTVLQGLVDWALPQHAYMPTKAITDHRFDGEIRSFNEQDGYGFIDSPGIRAAFGNDVCVHAAQLGIHQIGARVNFAILLNRHHKPHAFDVSLGDAASYVQNSKGRYDVRGEEKEFLSQVSEKTDNSESGELAHQEEHWEERSGDSRKGYVDGAKAQAAGKAGMSYSSSGFANIGSWDSWQAAGFGPKSSKGGGGDDWSSGGTDCWQSRTEGYPGSAPIHWGNKCPTSVKDNHSDSRDVTPSSRERSGVTDSRFIGTIRSFSINHGFGFIVCDEVARRMGEDLEVFLHKTQIGNFEVGDQVEFSVLLNRDRKPQAKNLVYINSSNKGIIAGKGSKKRKHYQ